MMADECEGDHHVIWNHSFQENGHFSSPYELENPHSSSFDEDFRFDFKTPEESSSKKIKLVSPFNQQEVEEEKEIDYSEESSPLGLTLRKSPSLISLLEKKLSQGRQTNNFDSICEPSKKPTSKMDDFASQPMSEKLKASNFAVMLLKIGTWERISMHEGDLVAKCYFAKQKLVWEVLEGALKSKIEILWSDIVAIRAIISDEQPGILEIELHQPPSFYREINPQPRKHTLWQTSSDFTGGQAPICRRHYIKFPPGALDKHYEKLLQCSERLQGLSKRPFPSQESPYFDANVYGYSEFSLDFNAYGYGSQYFPPHFPQLQYPYQSFPAVPLRAQNFRQTTLPPVRMMDSNSPISERNFMLENQRRALCGEANFAKGNNHMQLPRPICTSATHMNLNVPSHFVDDMTSYNDGTRRCNTNIGFFSDTSNQFLGDSQIVCSSLDENAMTSRMKSMYPLLDDSAEVMNFNNITGNEYGGMIMMEEEDVGDSTVVCCSEPMNWLPPDFDGGAVMQPPTNTSPYSYALSAYPMDEEFSNSSY